MKQYLLPTLALGLLVGTVAAQEKPDLNNPKQRASYSIGVDIGKRWKQQDLEIDPKALAAGMADAFAGKPALNDAEIRESLDNFQRETNDKVKNKQEGWLADNAKKEGVKVRPSGLQYKVIKSGSGKSPKATDTVKVHYHGTLINGTVFDSSVESGQPATFRVNQVIAGWTEALQLMKEGDKWQLFIPSKLAYGERAMGPKIGPNSTLIFEVELLSIEKAGQ